MKKFLISDTHFFHNNIIKYTNRPFSSVEDMNKYIIDQWNQVVSKNDLVYHLGDFAIGWDHSFQTKKECYRNILGKLNGTKILIRGNHDKETNKFYKDIGFEEIHPYLLINGTLLVHYPLEINEFQQEKLKKFIFQMKNIVKKYNINKIYHGHTHNRITGLKNHINASVEITNYRPIEMTDSGNSIF